MGNGEDRESLLNEIDKLKSRITSLEKTEILLFETSEQLRRNETWFRLLVENSMDLILVIDEKLNIKYVAPSIEKISGYSYEYFVNKNLMDFIHSANISGVKGGIERIISNPGEIISLEFGLKYSDGSWHNMFGTIKNLLQEPSVTGIVGNFMDITSRRKAEQELEDEKGKLDVTLGSIGEGVITIDSDGKVIFVNNMAEKLTGWSREDADGKSLNDIFNLIDEKTRIRYMEPVVKVLSSRGATGADSHTILVDKNGTERIISDNGKLIKDKHDSIIGTVIVFRDITEKVMMEKELIRTSKIESIGMLAGGIAHDFNNILAVLLGNISLAKMELESGQEDSLAERLSNMENASLQARDLTEQLLTFSKGGAPVTKFMSIRGLLKNAAEFATRGSNVKCELDISEGLWTVKIDEGQINQVINNLIINAMQAMPNGGKIKIDAENVVTGKEQALLLRPGSYVCFSVKDQGIGIPKEHISKIFDPYFTTKPKGTGLGLTTSYSIIKKHGGCITVNSTPGVGTEFHIYLPAFPGRVVENKKQEAVFVHGHGSVLIMDDQKDVRNVLGMMLEMAGYNVSYAENGEEAITLYKEALHSGKRFDAVIMDLTIPGGMGGREAIQKLIEIDPKVKAIASSGYSNDPVMSRYKKYGFNGIVVKPFEIKELSSTLNKVITGAD